jgi:hypothetical protein
VAVAVFANLSGIAVGSPIDVSIKTSVIVAIVVTALSKIDARRQNIDLLLANLGTSRTATFLLPLTTASCLEIVVHVLNGFEFVAGR